MPAIGDTRQGGGAVFRHRSHWTSRGTPKRALTQAEAESYVTAYNANLVGREKHRRSLLWYQCDICHQVHVGHVSPRR
jgi:hypothetical protein